MAFFLNEEKEEAARAEVMEVFDLCRQLDGLQAEKAEASALFLKRRLSSHEAATQTNKTNREIRPALKKLNAILGKFELVPQMDGFDSYTVFWKPARTRSLESWMPGASVVTTILEMTAAGTLRRVRQCLCGRWFFAHTDKKMVCSAACRIRKFRAKDPDGFRKKCAKRMQKYRSDPDVMGRQKKNGRPARKG